MNKADLEKLIKTVERYRRRIRSLRKKNVDLKSRIEELEAKIQDYIYRQRD